MYIYYNQFFIYITQRASPHCTAAHRENSRCSRWPVRHCLYLLSVKKFLKSLVLNCGGIFRSGDVWLFVNLATVLNKNLGLFWLLSMGLRICSVLAAFRACLFLDILFFHAISKNFQVIFSPFALKITNFFLERMGITVVPWRSTFFSNLF